uniref:Solute carrier family 45 member 4-like n=1 Tax=Phallusia mammillata TaxID=59560 RepID=A0A6F9DT24_9ASCI|nr:solute carrier family 45 member 4-like [Phallusia mammillata]
MEEGGDDSIEASIESKENYESQVKPSPSVATTIPVRRHWSALLLHAAIMCGREFLYAVEIVLVTPIILQLGMPEKYYSFMWCFSPIVGVLIGPVLGSKSDRCSSKFGRRRPFIVALVIGAILGLTFLIFSKDISHLLGGTDVKSQRLWGIIVGIFGAQTMDFCLDQAETPLRAFTLDVCLPVDQQRAFALQTVFIGIGGALGFIIDGIDWEKTAVSHYFGSQIKVVYLFAVLAYVSTTLCNLFSIKEIRWRKRVTPAITDPTKSTMSTQLPAIKISPSHLGSGSTNGQLGPMETSTKSDSTPLKAQEQSNHLDLPFAEMHCVSRPVSMIARVSFSKGLYISTSCPGGLNEHSSNDGSFSSFESDSACDDDRELKHCSSEELQPEEISVSMPTLQIKPNPKQGLLNYIRSKEFNKRAKSLDPKSLRQFSNDSGLPQQSTSELLPNKDGIMSDMDGTELNGNMLHSDEECGLKEPYSNGSSERTASVIRKLDLGEQTDLLSTKNKKKKKRPKKRKQKTQANNEDNPVSLRQLWLSVLTMPTQLRWLCVAQFLGFIGMEIILLWYTDLMGRVVFKGDPQGSANSTELKNYNAGVKMGCWGLTIYSLAMIIFSGAMEHFSLLRRVRIRLVYSISFMLVVVTTSIMFFFPTTEVILALSWCIGVTFSIMLTVPYVLVGKYHLIKQYVKTSPGNTKRGFGLDCAILACQMYMGNIFSSLISSPVIGLFGTVKAMLLTTAICHLAAFVVAYFLVFYPDEGGTWCTGEAERTNGST